MRKLITLAIALVSVGMYGQSIDVSTGYKSNGLTTSQLNALPSGVKTTGLLIRDSTKDSLMIWDGTAYRALLDLGGGGTIADGDKGDITVSASGATWTIDANAVGTTKIANGAITNAKIETGSIVFNKLNQNSATTGQVIKWSGTAWAAADDLNDQTAAEVPITDSGAYFTGTDVEAALQELGAGTAGGAFGIVASGSTDATNLTAFPVEGGSNTATVTITHSLGYSPSVDRIFIQFSRPDEQSTYSSTGAIGNITSTTFDVLMPGTSGHDLQLNWAIFGTGSTTPLDGGEIVSLIDTELGSTDWQDGGTAGQALSPQTGSSKTYSNSDVINAGQRRMNKHTANDTIILGSGITTYNQPWIEMLWGADSLYIKKGSGTTFYHSELSEAIAGDGFVLKGGRRASTIIATAANEFWLAGELVVHEEAPENLYTTANAANPENETDATTGANGVSNWTVSSASSTPSPHNGSYYLKWTHGGPDNTGYSGNISLTGIVENGKRYKVTLRANRIEGGNFIIGFTTGGGWVSQDALTFSAGSGYDQGVWYELSFEATSNSSTSYLTINASTNADTNNAVGIDSIVLEEIEL